MKYKVFSIIFSILLVITLPLALCSCSTQKSSKNDEIILRIANWEEYLDEGDWDDDEEIELENGKKIIGRNSMIKDFENWYEKTYHKKVKVEYSTFGTNEDMYNQLTIGDTYDLICPSEYMTMKLMAENKILKYSDEFWDTSDANNYYAKGVSPYIKKSLDQLKYQGQSVGDYIAGYMWGTLGYLYNPKYVSREDAEELGLLLNQKYYKKITAKDSVRDCYFAVRGMQTQKEILTKKFQNQSNYKERLSSLLNDTSDQSIQNAGMILSKIKDNVYSFETDSGKADLVSGKVVANLQWSGDGVYSMQQVEEEGIKLRYAVPKASTNLWFDGWCMLKSGIGKDKEKQQAAQAFVNYISRPDNVVRNMYYVGYTSVISGGEDKTIYDYIKYMYGSEDKKSVDYDLNYFFQQNGDNYNYVMKTSEEMSKGQLYAQYPTQDVMRRSAVMTYFGDQANKKISRMWIDMRCFDPRIKINNK